MRSNHYLNLFTSLKEANIRGLLNDKGFAVLKGQLVFEREGEIYITNIDEFNDQYTIEDYAVLPEAAPFELINGKLIFMASPTSDHQKVSINLSSALHFYVKRNKLGRVLAAPMDVYFDKTNVYQPDILFVLKERESIIGNFIQGVPEFIVEIISPGTKGEDESEKLAAYGKFGVQEYWLINPLKKSVEVFVGENGIMKKKQLFTGAQSISSKVIQKFEIAVEEIFE